MKKIGGRTKALGHIFALIAVIIWGVTFISTKKLLVAYSPLMIMTMRFTIAYIVLWILHPKWHSPKGVKEELFYVLAAFSGVFGYFLLENTSVMYTSVSNAGLILASAPIFVAILSHLLSKEEKITRTLVLGFIISMLGVMLVVFNGKLSLDVNPKGDLLALFAAMVWGLYSIITQLMSSQYSPLFVTRRTFFYGIIMGWLTIIGSGESLDLSQLKSDGLWLQILFLGLAASALCYVIWGQAMRMIGTLRTSNYIYIMPVVTMIASFIFLQEMITWAMVVGCAAILIGVYVADESSRQSGNQSKKIKKKQRKIKSMT